MYTGRNENLELTVKQIVESIDHEYSDEILKSLATAGGVSTQDDSEELT